MAYLAAYSGLRIGELLGLQKGDIEAWAQYPEGDIKRRIRVQRQVNVIEGRPVVTLPKGDKVRTTVYPKRTPETKIYRRAIPSKRSYGGACPSWRRRPIDSSQPRWAQNGGVRTSTEGSSTPRH